MRVARLDADQREFFEERAAMREYEGGLSRRQAEWAAWSDTLQHFARLQQPPASPADPENRHDDQK
jgi:hypothetical protein